MEESYRNFIKCLSSPTNSRSSQEISCIRDHLKSIEAIKTYKELTISEFARIARYEQHKAHGILYSQGSKSTSWYILLSGCVLVGLSMFLPRKSFGHRSIGSPYRFDECVILEDSELIVFDYSADRHAPATAIIGYSHGHTTGTIKEVDPIVGQNPSPNRGDSFSKRSSHASDSSSAFSGCELTTSDSHKTNSPFGNTSYNSDNDDDDVLDIDGISQDVYSSNDSFYDVISKDPKGWSESDIDIIVEGVHNMSAFINFTAKVKRELCRVMRVKTVSNVGEKIMDDGHIHDTWTVILDGTVEVRDRDGSVREFGRGDSFGVRSSALVNGAEQRQIGDMWTVTPSCLFISVPQTEFCEIVNRNSDSIIPETEDNGRVVLIYEERSGGRVIVRGTVEKLMHCLMEDQRKIDPMFVENFLITYRIFIKSPRILAEKLYSCYGSEVAGIDTRVKTAIRKCLLLWANNHFADFDDPKADMEEYLEKFDKMLSDGDYAAKDRLLYFVACSSNSRARCLTVNIEKNYMKKVPFRLTGLQRGLGLFVKEINRVTCPTQCGLRRGDQILSLANQPWDRLESLDKTYVLLNSHTTCSIHMVVKYNPSGFQDLLDDLSEPESEIEYESPNTGSLSFAFDMLYSSKRHSIVQDTSKRLRKRSGSVTLHEISDRRRGDLHCHITPMLVPRPIEYLPSSPPTRSKSITRSANTSPNRQLIRQKSMVKYDPVIEKGSYESNKQSKNINNKSSSNPDLKPLDDGYLSSSNNNLCITYQVLKVFRPYSPDGKLVLLTNNTTAKEAVTLAMKEFNIDVSEADNFGLYLVSVDAGPTIPVIKSSRVAIYLKDLAGKLALNQRYYLRHSRTELNKLITEDQSKSVLNETKVTLTHLSPPEIATTLTLIDYTLFQDIQSAEYINFIMKLPLLGEEEKMTNSNLDASKLEQSKHKIDGFSTGCENYKKFEHIINRDTFWPTSEICLETNVNKRSDLIKKFIKVAKICKDLKNFHSLMCIVYGLALTPVSRLKSSWDKVPKKSKQLYEELSFFTDMSCNFRQIRRLVSPEISEPPIIPCLAIHSKDLATIHMGNKTYAKDGLINFEKLCMMASEIRKLTRMASACYNLSAIFSSTMSRNTHSFFTLPSPGLASSTLFDESDGTNGILGAKNNSDNSMKKSRSNSVDQSAFNATLKKRHIKRKSFGIIESQNKNPKKIYEDWLSTLKVRTYLSNLDVLMDVNRLQDMSYALEPHNCTISSSTNISSSMLLESPPTNKTADIKVTKSKATAVISPLQTTTNSQKATSSNNVPAQPISTTLKELSVPVIQQLKGRPQSIFSHQNQEDIDKLMELVQVTRKVSTRRKVVNSNENNDTHGGSNVTVNEIYLRNLPMYNNNKQLIQELRLSQCRPERSNNDAPGGVTLNLQQISSEPNVQKTSSTPLYCYPVAGWPVNNCYHGVTSCRPTIVSNEGVSLKPPIAAKPQPPSYNQYITQANHQDQILQKRPTVPPQPPPRTVTIVQRDSPSTVKHQNG